MGGFRCLILLVFLFSGCIFVAESCGPKQDFIDDSIDVATGKRPLIIEGSPFDGSLKISTGYTDKEKIMFAAIGVGILLVLLCCCAGCKSSKKAAPTVIMYQQMPPPVQQHQSRTVPGIHGAGASNGLGTRNAGFSEMPPQAGDLSSPPPPYPGFSSK